MNNQMNSPDHTFDWWTKESKVIDRMLRKLIKMKKALTFIANAHEQSNPTHLKKVAREAIKESERKADD